MKDRAFSHSHRFERLGLALALACAGLLCVAAIASAAPGTEPTRLVYAAGKIVPIPAAIPHEEGDMVDRRILPDLRWIAQRYPIYVTDGYSGPLPNGEPIVWRNNRRLRAPGLHLHLPQGRRPGYLLRVRPAPKR